MTALDVAGLATALADWLPETRWFGSKGRPIRAITVESDAVLREEPPTLYHAIATVAYDDGGPPERYQVPVGVAEEVPEHLTGALIGEVADGTAYDAVHDADFSRHLLELVAEAGTVGGLTFHLGVPPPDGEPLDITLHGRVLGAEQSNTSLLYGESYVCKIYRRVAPGENPDLEVTRALADVGCEAVPPPLGWVEGELDGVPTTFALLQPFLRLAVDGWALAATSVRDLFAEADLHADEVGGDFAGESERLGSTTAQVHSALAQAFPTSAAGPNEVRQLAAAMTQRVDEACRVVPELHAYADALRAAYTELAGVAEKIVLQRIHGDFHLGQVLRTDHGWTLIDFEGEPAKPLDERIAPDSALRDVAGMLRSFDYAARHLLAGRAADQQLAYRATEWAERNREAFCDGYAQAAGADPRQSAVLLRAYELDKAVYELVYEARHRPSWVAIPLTAIERLVT